VFPLASASLAATVTAKKAGPSSSTHGWRKAGRPPGDTLPSAKPPQVHAEKDALISSRDRDEIPAGETIDVRCSDRTFQSESDGRPRFGNNLLCFNYNRRDIQEDIKRNGRR